MKTLFFLSFQSLRHRKTVSLLTIASIALSVSLLLSVENLRRSGREGFSGTLSQTDLIVGAKGGSLQLLLYTIFHLGSPTNNLRIQSYQEWKKHPAVDWTIPISLGDSFRGFRVVGTNADFYTHYRYRQTEQIEFTEGHPPRELFEVALGSEVAERLSLHLNDPVVLSHGISEGDSLYDHGDKPFRVAGVLKKTGTPIDRTVSISLEGLEAIHIDWKEGIPPDAEKSTPADHIRVEDLKPTQITAFLLRAKSRGDALRLQREINAYSNEPLMAIIPGVSLSELWEALSYAENILKAVTLLVVLISLLGMIISLFTTLSERRREIAILRSLGASPAMIGGLLLCESTLLTFFGILAGFGIFGLGLSFFRPALERNLGLSLPFSLAASSDFVWLALILGVGSILGALPAVKAYRQSLTDGLSQRL